MTEQERSAVMEALACLKMCRKYIGVKQEKWLEDWVLSKINATVESTEEVLK